jgi:LytS/YehU family sensor histidine kinase
LHLQQEKFAFKLQNATVQEELRKSQLASLKSQMNPHFMFNALNSIQEFIILNDKQKANMYMGKFADLMRMTLDMSNKETVSLQDELKCLNLYLELEALRFEDSFNYEISVDQNISADEIYLPSMLIQPYIENAVKHGLLHKSKDRKLKITFSLINVDTLNCIIEDNGIGRKRSNEINNLRHKKHTSFATGATQNRLELLNYNKTEAISVHFTDLNDNTNTGIGTIVSINIPV